MTGYPWAEFTDDVGEAIPDPEASGPPLGEDNPFHDEHRGNVYPINGDDEPTLTPEQVAAKTHTLNVENRVRKLREDRDARSILKAEDAGELPPFDAGTLAEMLARPPLPKARIGDLIPWEGSTLLTAQRKTGKTTLTLNTAHSLITGNPFLGSFDVRPIGGNVGFLNYEMTGAALAYWAQLVGIPKHRLYLVNLRGRRNPLSQPEDRESLAKALRNHDVESLIIDPFGRAFTGVNQNDAGEVTSFLTDLDHFARTEVGAKDLILTAHAGWGADNRTRGSSALEDWGDSLITLTKDQGDDGTGGRYLSAIGRDVDVEEDRLAFDPDTHHLTLTGEGPKKAVSKKRAQINLEPLILHIISQRPGINGVGITEALKRDHVPARNDDRVHAINTLVQSKEVECIPGPRGSKTYTIRDPQLGDL